MTTTVKLVVPLADESVARISSSLLKYATAELLPVNVSPAEDIHGKSLPAVKGRVCNTMLAVPNVPAT
jgi:hypothetical protein